METTYIVTAKKHGKMTFKFDVNGDLVYFKYEGELFNDLQRAWFYPRLPVNEKQMKLWQAIKEFNVSKGEIDLSFDRFWATYALKSKKLVCEALWKKMTDEDKFNAIAHIKRYNNWLRLQGTAKALPDTYLRQKRWLDEL